MSMWMNAPHRYGPAAGPIFQTLYQQPGVFANALSGNYGSYANALAGLGKSQADSAGAYYAGLGSLAQARANERGAMYGANAMAEAARQGATANLGSAALGAYGGAANSAMAAWAANQQAYNKAASDMQAANAQGMSNYGMSRNNALGTLSGAHAGLGRAQIGANALGNMNFATGDGGNGFAAFGPSGNIASGSYSSGGYGGQASGGATGGGDALAGLDGLRGDVTSADIPDRLDRMATDANRRLDAQHYSSRDMPSDMLGQTLSGLMTLQRPAYQGLSSGMNQFYANTKPDDSFYNTMLSRLGSGSASGLGNVMAALTSGFGTANSGVQGMWNQTLGKSPEFMTSAQREVDQRGGLQEQQRTRDLSRLDHLNRMANSQYVPDSRKSYYTQAADRVRKALGTF